MEASCLVRTELRGRSEDTGVPLDGVSIHGQRLCDSGQGNADDCSAVTDVVKIERKEGPRCRPNGQSICAQAEGQRGIRGRPTLRMQLASWTAARSRRLRFKLPASALS